MKLRSRPHTLLVMRRRRGGGGGGKGAVPRFRQSESRYLISSFLVFDEVYCLLLFMGKVLG